MVQSQNRVNKRKTFGCLHFYSPECFFTPPGYPARQKLEKKNHMNLWHEFHGPNAGYILELYEKYQRDPQSVDAATREAV
jgi:hypothetical protein